MTMLVCYQSAVGSQEIPRQQDLLRYDLSPRLERVPPISGLSMLARLPRFDPCPLQTQLR